jgi:hypothetical protein
MRRSFCGKPFGRSLSQWILGRLRKSGTAVFVSKFCRVIASTALRSQNSSISSQITGNSEFINQEPLSQSTKESTKCRNLPRKEEKSRTQLIQSFRRCLTDSRVSVTESNSATREIGITGNFLMIPGEINLLIQTDDPSDCRFQSCSLQSAHGSIWDWVHCIRNLSLFPANLKFGRPSKQIPYWIAYTSIILELRRIILVRL